MRVFTLRSNDLEVIDYDRTTSTVRVTYRDGQQQDYLQVPTEVFDALLLSQTKESFFTHHIQGRFPSRSTN
jgi:hypothetical protein